jgi:predicted nuclease of predicted toxin-antitoxin system
MKIVLDMNLSPDWVPVLRNAGHDAVHWSTVGDPGASDRVIMAWAAENTFVVFTHDLDFGAILASSQLKTPSVIQLRSQDILPDVAAELLLNALQQFAPELTAGALMTINENKTRARILPIQRESDRISP